MKIDCFGTDPAALYFAIAMKSRCSEHDVRVVDITSDPPEEPPPHILETPINEPFVLEDEETMAEINASALTLSGAAIRLEHNLLRIPGHTYRLIAPATLSAILKRRALSLGCRIVMASTGDEGRRTADITIAGDGAMSRLRDRHSLQFRTSVDPSATRHAIFEVEQSADCISYLFQPTKYGVFHAFIYPKDRRNSALIVEASEHTLASAGLEVSGVRSADFVTDLFAADIPERVRGTPTAIWKPFIGVRNLTWRVDNLFLLGAAAYTSHFSIDLATRLSLEDAQTLANALHAVDRETELKTFQQTRLAKSESLLRAQRASLTWFEHVHRYIDKPFDQFVYSCLTSSLRLNHTDLELTAPKLTREVETIVAGDFRTTKGKLPPPMMTPFRLRGMTVPNRIAVSPMCMYSADDGIVNDFHLVHLGSRAIGGAGLVITEMTDVSPDGRISLHCAGMYAPEHIPAWRRITDFVHRSSDAKIAIQLGHAGRKGSLTRSWEGHRELGGKDGWRTLAPSALAFSPERSAPKEMTRPDMDCILDAFVTATNMCDEAGFDMIEIHMAHGYLLSSFISPLSNRRTDAYGGSLENRLRFPLEVFNAVRHAWPADKPISVRISAVDWIDGGTTIEDAFSVSKTLHAAGNDIVAVSTGGVTSERRPNVGPLYQTTFSDQIRNELKIPTMAVGGIASFGDANAIIAAGRADFCALARGYLNDPYFVRHAAQSQGYTDLKWPSEYRGADQLPIRENYGKLI